MYTNPCSQNYTLATTQRTPGGLSWDYGNYFLEAYRFVWDCYRHYKSNKALEEYQSALASYRNKFKKLEDEFTPLVEKAKDESVPHAQTLQPDAALRHAWIQAISEWLEGVSDEFLLIIDQGLNGTPRFRKKLELELPTDDVRKFLKTFQELPSLPQNLYLFQGQSSPDEPIYFGAQGEGAIFSMKAINSVSTNVNMPFYFIDPYQGKRPIYCVYKINSAKVKALPVAQIHREMKRRNLPDSNHRMYASEEEVLLEPKLVYKISSISELKSYNYNNFRGYTCKCKELDYAFALGPSDSVENTIKTESVEMYNIDVHTKELDYAFTSGLSDSVENTIKTESVEIYNIDVHTKEDINLQNVEMLTFFDEHFTRAEKEI